MIGFAPPPNVKDLLSFQPRSGDVRGLPWKCAGRPRDFATIAALLAEVPQRINVARINAVLKKSKIMPPTHERKLRALLAEIKR